MVEFVLVAVALLVPLVYLVMYAASVQRASFAATSAVRDAGRAYATAGSDQAGRDRAVAATALALDGAHVGWAPADLQIECQPQPCTYAPGSAVTIHLAVDVPLPGLGTFLGESGRGSVAVRAHHRERLDCHTAGSPLAGQC